MQSGELNVRTRDALQLARGRLDASGVEAPGFEAEYLLRHTLGCTRETLLLELDTDIPVSAQRRFDGLIERRASGEPSAYITGHKEFYGLDFKVDPRALIPRPETELLVELGLDFASQRTSGGTILNIVDVGTGCGVIAVALAVHLPKATITATDLFPEALELAAENVARHHAEDRVTLLHGDLLAPVSRPIDILVSNPPYIPSPEIPNLAREITNHEPGLALDGGPDGMAVIERLVQQTKDKLSPSGAMFIEIGWDQGRRALAHARHLWPDFKASITPDLAGLDRVLTIRSPVGVAQPV